MSTVFGFASWYIFGVGGGSLRAVGRLLKKRGGGVVSIVGSKKRVVVGGVVHQYFPKKGGRSMDVVH